MRLDARKVAANEVHVQLSTVCEAKARGAALALGEVEYPVRQQGSGGVIACVTNAPENPENLDNQLGQVATLLRQVTGALGSPRVSGAANPFLISSTCASVLASSSSRESRSGDSASFLIHSRPC